MSIALNTTYESVVMDNLVNRAGDVGQIKLTDTGVIKKGSVIDTTGKVLASGATAAYILCDTVDTTETTIADVWKNGNFIAQSLVVAEGYTLSDANIEQLRQVGIIVEDAI